MKLLLVFAILFLLPSSAPAQELRIASDYERALFRQRTWDECVQHYAAAADSGAEYTSISFYAAVCQANLGNFDAAFAELLSAVQHGLRAVDALHREAAFTPLQPDSRWAALVSRCQLNADRYERSLNPELLRLFEADQADRQPPIDEPAVMVRDESRRRRVLSLVRSASLVSAGDFFHAAFILQHSCLSDDYALAHRLAARASALDPWDGGKRWLVAATKDRYLGSIGKAQVYGTQYIPIDGSVVNDEERLRMCVRPFLETLDAIDRMNGRLRAK